MVEYSIVLIIYLFVIRVKTFRTNKPSSVLPCRELLFCFSNFTDQV